MSKPRCKHLVVPPSKSGRIIVRSDNVYRCACPVPDIPALPVSITKAYGFQPISEKIKRFVSAGECVDCPCFDGGQS